MFRHPTEGLAVAMILGFFISPTEKIFFLAFGLFSAGFPDIDLLIYLYWHGWKIDQFAHEHREILHKPAILIFGGGIIVWFLLGFDFCLLWVCEITIHLIHDTIFEGWGIRWLPFDERYFILAKYSPKKIIADLDEQKKIVVQYGDPEWFKKQRQISAKSVIELIFFLIMFCCTLWWVLF